MRGRPIWFNAFHSPPYSYRFGNFPSRWSLLFIGGMNFHLFSSLQREDMRVYIIEISLGTSISTTCACMCVYI
jgi:hypothetical protein